MGSAASSGSSASSCGAELSSALPSRAELKAASTELARQRAHAEIAIHQTGDELTGARAALDRTAQLSKNTNTELDL